MDHSLLKHILLDCLVRQNVFYCCVMPRQQAKWKKKDISFRIAILVYIRCWSYVKAYEDSTVLEHQVQRGRKTQVLVAWKAPPYGWCALNTDGAAKSGTQQVGCGG
ncbi:hypothetical protein L195_g053339 [Trifolium pratense]|uniref:Uncharacterized protein n=1 Tax=Trifolium pratense TaxID=57577 RepID=A0A2K3KA03_TRIPR|nr:hypothetical protein L195_g053339 [Trifolium pratense]